MKRSILALSLVVGVVLGAFLSHAGFAWAGRNGSGTYSLPAGNPVVTGTTITSTWANNTLADLSTEMTDSLSRSGKGGMSAALKGVNGSASAPAYSFNSETNSGLYRAAAGDVRLSLGGSDLVQCTSGEVKVTGTASTTDAAVYGIGGTNKPGVRGDGTGTAPGVYGVGAGSTKAGVEGVGGTNGLGVVGTGNGTGTGVQGNGGATDAKGVEGIGGGTNGIGVTGQGKGTGAGVYAWNSTAFSGGVNDNAHPGLQVAEGGAKFAWGNTASTTAWTNQLTQMNLPKAWALVHVTGGSASITSGFNIASASISTTQLSVTFASAFANTNYVCVAMQGSGGDQIMQGASSSTTVWVAKAWDVSDVAFKDWTTVTTDVDLVCFGAQ